MTLLINLSEIWKLTFLKLMAHIWLYLATTSLTIAQRSRLHLSPIPDWSDMIDYIMWLTLISLMSQLAWDCPAMPENWIKERKGKSLKRVGCGEVSYMSAGHRRGYNLWSFTGVWAQLKMTKSPKDAFAESPLRQAFVKLNVVSCSSEFWSETRILFQRGGQI